MGHDLGFPTAHSFSHTGRTLTMNSVASQHWSKTSGVVKEWREAFGWQGAQSRIKIRNTRVGIEVTVRSRHVGRAGDAAAHAYLAKGALDGLVDARVLVDDDRSSVAWLRFHAPSSTKGIPAGCVNLTLELVLLDDEDRAGAAALDVPLDGGH